MGIYFRFFRQIDGADPILVKTEVESAANIIGLHKRTAIAINIKEERNQMRAFFFFFKDRVSFSSLSLSKSTDTIKISPVGAKICLEVEFSICMYNNFLCTYILVLLFSYFQIKLHKLLAETQEFGYLDFF